MSKNNTNNSGVLDVRVSALEKNDEKIEHRLEVNEKQIVEIRLQIKDLRTIRQIVYGLVGLGLLSVWDKLPL